MRNWLTLERPCGRSLAPLGTAPTCVHPLQGSENNAFLILVFIRTRYLRSFASSGVTDSTDLLDYSRVVVRYGSIPQICAFGVDYAARESIRNCTVGIANSGSYISVRFVLDI